jgi:hypothetical protein
MMKIEAEVKDASKKANDVNGGKMIPLKFTSNPEVLSCLFLVTHTHAMYAWLLTRDQNAS